MIGVGGSAHIFQVVVAEEVGTVGLLHDTAVLADIYGDVMGDISLLQPLEGLYDVFLVGACDVLARSSGMSPLGCPIGLWGERELVGIIEVYADHHTVGRVVG